MTTQVADDDSGWLANQMAEEVRALMARRRVKQVELCRLLNLSQAAVSNRLTGKTVFDVRELGMLASFFEVTPAQLLGDDVSLSRTPGYLGNETYAVVLPFRATRTRSRTLPPMPMPPTTPGHARPALRRAS